MPRRPAWRRERALRRPPSLRNRRDWQGVAYLAAQPALAAWQWLHGLSWPLYGLMLFLTLGVGVIHHNHAHRRMWRGRWANRATDFWLTLLQGHPTFVFHAAHNANHHRYVHGPRDAARTYRFGGDTNHLLGYLLHPVQAAWVLYPLFFASLRRLRGRSPGAWRYCMAQYGAWLGLWGGLLAANPSKALVLVIVPQLHGLHWLLATNYLQHAHADGGPQRRCRMSYARNFEGLANPLLFNIGLHTAHHEHGRMHWSELPRVHREQYRHRIPAELIEPGLVRYMLRVYLVGLVVPRCRTRAQMHPGSLPISIDLQERPSGHAHRL